MYALDETPGVSSKGPLTVGGGGPHPGVTSPHPGVSCGVDGSLRSRPPHQPETAREGDRGEDYAPDYVDYQEDSVIPESE